MEFVWNRKGRTVRIDGGEPLQWFTPTLGELKGFQYRLERAAEVFRLLQAARDAYEGGRAAYANASVEVRNLLTEGERAAREVMAVAEEITQWIPALSGAEVFRAKGDDLLSFCRGWISAVQHPMAVRKNSSRARSANSPGVPPRIAESAADSSSGPAENSGESGSTPRNGSTPPIAPGANGS